MSELIEKVENNFPKEVANHTLEIQLDQGVFRHLVFSNAGSWHQRFSLTTTPGRLVYAGDMGCFVFERSGDMLEIFRRDPDRFKPGFDYWHEKLSAVDNHGGSKEYDVDVFREWLETQLRFCDDLSSAAGEQIRDCIEECVLTFESSGPDAAVELAHDFELDSDDDAAPEFLHDVSLRHCMRYTERYVWACYAIQWGVAKYDAVKAEAVPT